MIPLMLAQIRVWTQCPVCGPCQKLESEVDLPFDVITPILEKTAAVCDRCRGSAVMYFERKASRLH
jgi:C4-type Zn-finger protein